MQDLYHQPFYDPVPPYTQNLINTKPLNPYRGFDRVTNMESLVLFVCYNFTPKPINPALS